MGGEDAVLLIFEGLRIRARLRVTCSTSGGAAKQCPTSLRHSWKSAELAEVHGVVLQRVPVDEQPVALRLFVRALQRHALAAFGRLKSARPFSRRLRTRFHAGLHVDLRDFEDHVWGFHEAGGKKNARHYGPRLPQ